MCLFDANTKMTCAITEPKIIGYGGLYGTRDGCAVVDVCFCGLACARAHCLFGAGADGDAMMMLMMMHC